MPSLETIRTVRIKGETDGVDTELGTGVSQSRLCLVPLRGNRSTKGRATSSRPS
jgi:hypothetical protein